jgi:hypothetical protein
MELKLVVGLELQCIVIHDSSLLFPIRYEKLNLALDDCERFLAAETENTCLQNNWKFNMTTIIEEADLRVPRGNFFFNRNQRQEVDCDEEIQ